MGFGVAIHEAGHAIARRACALACSLLLTLAPLQWGGFAEPLRYLAVASPMDDSQEARLLASGKRALLRALDDRMGDRTFESWFRSLLGPNTPARWEVNDCGEATGSPADSA